MTPYKHTFQTLLPYHMIKHLTDALPLCCAARSTVNEVVTLVGLHCQDVQPILLRIAPLVCHLLVNASTLQKHSVTLENAI